MRVMQSTSVMVVVVAVTDKRAAVTVKAQRAPVPYTNLRDQENKGNTVCRLPLEKKNKQ